MNGDVPLENKKLAKELQKFERTVDMDTDYKSERKAQMYTCLAHDWFQLCMEEEGNRLLLKADDVCPGYFKDIVIEHMKENPDFATLIKNLTTELICLMAETLKSK